MWVGSQRAGLMFLIARRGGGEPPRGPRRGEEAEGRERARSIAESGAVSGTETFLPFSSAFVSQWLRAQVAIEGPRGSVPKDGAASDREVR